MTESQKNAPGAAVRIPPPVLGILTIVAGYLAGRVLPILTHFDLPTPVRYWAGGIIVAVSIGILGVWPIQLFKKSGQNPTPWSETPEIIVLGPYKFTRNPMYLMMIFVCIGIGVILSEAWIMIFTPILMVLLYHVAIKQEEAYLEVVFGDSYRDYKKRVRRWL
ncbi:MAG: methyltransferase family protein [Woeseiaceae bacterium]